MDEPIRQQLGLDYAFANKLEIQNDMLTGEVLGTRQSGAPDFRLVRPDLDQDLIAAARDDAKLILQTDPHLTTPRGAALRHLIYLFERDEAIRLLRAG